MISPLDRSEIEAALGKAPADDRGRAWDLRHAFDRVLENARFEPYLEAPLPEGGNSFWTLFQHIKENDVQMTAPVEMTMSEELREMDMAFLYEGPEQGEAGLDGRVQVLDLEPMAVLSIGMRGRQEREILARSRAWVEAVRERDGWERAGAWRVLGYNSPMVSGARRFWELQLPVTRSP